MSSPWTAVVPLRAGSKGVPSKNVRCLGGRPLFWHALDQAIAAGAASVLITTDIPEVLEADLPAEVRLVERPPELAGDEVPMEPVLRHALQTAQILGTVALLQATSPLRLPSDINAALQLYWSGNFEIVMSVTLADRSVLKWGTQNGEGFQPLSDPAYCFMNRQQLPEVVKPNGAIYIFDAGWLLSHRSFVSNRIGVVRMPVSRSQDIDSEEDFLRCEDLLKQLNCEGKLV